MAEDETGAVRDAVVTLRVWLKTSPPLYKNGTLAAAPLITDSIETVLDAVEAVMEVMESPDCMGGCGIEGPCVWCRVGSALDLTLR